METCCLGLVHADADADLMLPLTLSLTLMMPHTPHSTVGSQVAINRDTLSGRRDNVYKVGKATGRLLMDAAIDAVNQKQKTTAK